ncbi:hypothetical protein BCR44DRAFT_115627 [Catenaria anguillulae PL171]|uniref:tRNA pseudouridine(55) synthase n=1 Tax=Catenaria anguillulae PL171 TaxID=765915 RepID=A0A1Y2HNT9_9FUNG|nr:hypothetical protein BCR44DRAFT_115627 [Catenaria anguillulae PL171]
MRQSDLRVRREPIYFGGRYLKLDRPIAQTAWVLDGKRMTELSVGECIGDVVQRVTGASEVVMVAAGREDADVRMVGRGRPFYLEVKNPRCTVVDVERVAKEVNEKWAGKVGVSQLGWVNKSDLKLVKLGEEMKPKTYSCLLWLNRPTRDAIHKVNTTTDLLVHQLTPTRVLHRRPNVVRDKLIHSIELAPVDEAAGFYRAVLKTQAGTYIKEFCHGDFGRTSPSLRTLLGTQVDILELDVVDIDLEWPPIGPATSDGAAENE